MATASKPLTNSIEDTVPKIFMAPEWRSHSSSKKATLVLVVPERVRRRVEYLVSPDLSCCWYTESNTVSFSSTFSTCMNNRYHDSYEVRNKERNMCRYQGWGHSKETSPISRIRISNQHGTTEKEGSYVDTVAFVTVTANTPPDLYLRLEVL